MPLTTAQMATFKAAINADPALAADRTAGRHGVIADYYNAAGAGSVWRPQISVGELNTAVVWTEFAALSALLQNAYMAMTQGLSIDATSANIRTGFATVFGPATTSRANLLALAARAPTRFEALFAVSSVTPVFGQLVTVTDVAAALGS